MPSSSDPTPPETAGPAPDQAPDQAEDYVPDHGLPKLSRLNVALLTMSILSISAALYLSPVGQTATAEVRESVADTLPGASSLLAVEPTPTASASPTASGSGPTASPTGGRVSPTSASPSTAPSPVPYGGLPGLGSTPTPTTPPVSPSGVAGQHHGNQGNHGGQGGKNGGASPSTSPVVAVKTKCWQFAWQQDAQVVYVRNLSDPYGLDGAAGPYNGDGLACSDLKVDPSRPASVPVGAYVPPSPSTRTKAALVNPDQDYYGFSQDGIPGDTKMLQGFAASAGKTPSTVGWFSSFDQTYRADLVEKAWTYNALPVITWMPIESGSGHHYSLSTIIDGTWDAYLRRYAADIVRENRPVSIRLMHEMNGNWYGWSAGMTSYNNSPEKFIAAWRHIHDVFEEVGANDDVIWMWAPSRIDDLNPKPTNGLTDPADDYPGDAYVDWMGASVYLRKATIGTSYAASFAKTVARLKEISDKPIFFAETGAPQSIGGQDTTDLKVAWIHNVLPEFARDDRIVGFLWFNNIAAVPILGQMVNSDWRIDSSAAALAAFKEEVANAAFASGVMPD